MEASPDYYRRQASKCLALAQQTSDPGLKLELLSMAEAWQSLAHVAGADAPPNADDDPPVIIFKHNRQA